MNRGPILLVALVAAIAVAVFYATRGSELPHRIVVARGTTEQFTYSHLFGHTVACAGGGEWRVRRTPGPVPRGGTRIRVGIVGDGYVNVSCPRVRTQEERAKGVEPS